jgi:Uncharacterised protein family (UPF0137)
MSKSSVFENKAFQQSAPAGIGFNLISQINSFNSVFDTKPLDAVETSRIEKLLTEGFQPGLRAQCQVADDIASLKQITAEIKAIGRQGTVLMGERVHRARELLKPYKDGTFTRWLESAFGTRKTGYNALAYYELYTALPHDSLRESFKKLQQRTAYVLASRKGAVETKAEIISEYQDRSHDELVILIQEKLPVASGDRRLGKTSNDRLIDQIRDNFKKLQKKKQLLSERNKRDIFELRALLDSLL